MAYENAKRLALSAAAALLGLIGIIQTLREPPIPSIGWVFGLLVLTALSFGTFFLALRFTDRQTWKIALPLGIFFGLCVACGVELYRVDRLDNSLDGVTGRLFSAVSLGLILSAGTALLIKFIPRLTTGKNLRLSSPAIFGINWGIIFVCWLPCFIAFFPGIFAYDIPTQLIGISQGTLTSDHPLLHTLIAWGCIRVGAWLHSYTLGATIYTLVQMLTLSASFAAAIAYLHRRGTSLAWQIGSLAFFALLPIHPIFAVNATKDVLFTACTIFFLLFATELIRRPQECLRSPRFWIGYTVAVLAMALMRNTGIYVIVLFVPVMVFALPRRRRLLTLSLALFSIVVFFTVQTGLKASLNIAEGRFTEALSVPLQQMARCAYDNVLDEEELAELERFIPHEVWRTYYSRLADQIKNAVDREAIKEDPLGWFALWCKLGLRHPGCYINAFLGLNIGYWYPDMPYPDTRTWHAYIECDTKSFSDEICIADPDLWPSAREFYREIGHNTNFESIPLINLFFKPGIYLWLTLAALAAAIFHRSRGAAFLLSFLLLSWLLQCFSPIALLRYAYPFMAALPLAAGLIRKKE